MKNTNFIDPLNYSSWDVIRILGFIIVCLSLVVFTLTESGLLTFLTLIVGFVLLCFSTTWENIKKNIETVMVYIGRIGFWFLIVLSILFLLSKVLWGFQYVHFLKVPIMAGLALSFFANLYLISKGDPEQWSRKLTDPTRGWSVARGAISILLFVLLELFLGSYAI